MDMQFFFKRHKLNNHKEIQVKNFNTWLSECKITNFMILTEFFQSNVPVEFKVMQGCYQLQPLFRFRFGIRLIAILSSVNFS